MNDGIRQCLLPTDYWTDEQEAADQVGQAVRLFLQGLGHTLPSRPARGNVFRPTRLD